MSKTQLSMLLDSYVKGTCTPEETAMIEAWLARYQDDENIIDTMPPDVREQLRSRMFAGVILDAGIETDKNRILPPATSRTINKRWIGIAAVALMLICFKFFVLDTRLAANKSNQTASLQIHLVNKTKFIVKQLLSDGSIVWLTPGSTLNYPQAFNISSRNVDMTGECFFEITKNPKHPFIINSEHIVTKVWGTSFRITDYINAKTASVVVVTGKVSVTKKDNSASHEIVLGKDELILHPKQGVSFNAENNSLTEDKQPDMTSLDRWKRIDLTFNKTRLPAIVAVLNKNFNANIIIGDDKLNDVVMNADLNDLNLPEVLDVLKTSLKLDYEATGNRIILKRTN